MKRNVVKILFLAVFVLCCSAVGVSQMKNKQSTADITFIVNKIESHPDDHLIRVCGDLKSRPNTSACIDEITLVGPSTIIATDTDGFDLKRYFQWEEDGTIDVEIDFPTKNPATLKKNFKKYNLVFELRDGRKVKIVNK